MIFSQVIRKIRIVTFFIKVSLGVYEMLMKLFYLVLFIYFSSSQNILAEDCSTSFDQIDSECVAEVEDSLVAASFILDKLKTGQVIFYKTSEKYLGKMKVIGKEITKGECTLYWESETYSKPTSYKTNSSASINNRIGLWSDREVNLDFKGRKSDFVIKVEANKKGIEECRIEFVNGSNASLYKIMDELPSVTGNKLIYYAALVLVGLAFFLAAFNYLGEEAKFNEDEKFNEQSEDAEQKRFYQKHIILKYSRPIIKRYFLETISRMKGIEKVKEKYKRPLANAGLIRIITPTEFYSLKFLLVIAFPIGFIIFNWLFDIGLSVDYVLFAIIIGYFYPDIWVKSRIQQRREEMFLAMPFIVDMLALSIEAGLDFVAAISRVMEKAPPSAMTEEFQTMIKEIKIGSSRGEALRQLSWRVDEISVNSFCATLIAADSVGASVGPVLKSISRELRNKRSALIEKKASQAASRIMVPMILIILPAIAIVVFVPAFMDMAK